MFNEFTKKYDISGTSIEKYYTEKIKSFDEITRKIDKRCADSRARLKNYTTDIKQKMDIMIKKDHVF